MESFSSWRHRHPSRSAHPRPWFRQRKRGPSSAKKSRCDLTGVHHRCSVRSRTGERCLKSSARILLDLHRPELVFSSERPSAVISFNSVSNNTWNRMVRDQHWCSSGASSHGFDPIRSDANIALLWRQSCRSSTRPSTRPEMTSRRGSERRAAPFPLDERLSNISSFLCPRPPCPLPLHTTRPMSGGRRVLSSAEDSVD